MVTGQIICVNLNAHVDINSDSTWDRNMSDLEQIHLRYLAQLFLNCGQL